MRGARERGKDAAAVIPLAVGEHPLLRCELSATGKGGITCSGGILYNPATQTPHYPVLAYGKGWRLGGFSCTSAVTGVTCHNGAGHGLFISRQSWRGY